MRVLVALLHYFRGEENSRHSSTDIGRREQRAAGMRAVVDAWRGHLGPVSWLNHHRHGFEGQCGMEDALDIVAVINGDNHLLDRAHCNMRGVALVDAKIDDPRMLGFAVHRLFADMRHRYDMFVYSEDDLRPPDGALLSRIMAFQHTFGWRRLLQPNRYEWNPGGLTLKTYIDGDVPPQWVKPYHDALPDDAFLRQQLPGRTVVHHRAGNPHAGFFALTAEQLAYWIGQPHFGDLDRSFVSPIESASTLGLMKTFPIYKAFGRDAGWLEIEHLDTRYSSGWKPSAVTV